MSYKNELNMLEEAVFALSEATEAMQKRMGEIGLQLSAEKRRRKDFLQSEVERLLPAISKRVEARLEQEAPAFITKNVRASFAQNRKFLGLFAGRNYQPALTALQAKLSQFIESRHTKELEPYDKIILELNSEVTKLELRLYETNATLKLLMNARVKEVKLPPQAKHQVAQIVSNFRQFKNTTSPSRSHGGYPPTNTSSDNDLWFYMLTDIPTSLRTLMLDSFSSHQTHHNHDDHSGNFHRDTDTSTPVTSQSNFMADNDAAGMAAFAIDAGVNSIATDDRLGAFS